MNINLENLRKIHFIGIGGIGVSAVAKLMIKQGKTVSGSDNSYSEITKEIEKKGAKIFIGHCAENISPDIDLVIFSPAVPTDNQERLQAKKLKIPEASYPQSLQLLSKDLETVAISGTNGKSTTTSMLGLFLEKAKIDPTVIVGSQVKSFIDGNLRFGKSKYFVVEACEYKESMLSLKPQMIILTNIEKDHLDYYKDLAHIKNSFIKYIKKLPPNGVLAYNADDKICQEISTEYLAKKISYGINNKADIEAKNIKVKNEKQTFDLWYQNKNLGKITLKIPGIFNIYNALAAISIALYLKTSFSDIEKVLKKFSGIWRRFEIVGEYKKAKIISDYAHHPTAIQQTLKATKDFFPNKRIIAVFQPHSWNRTKNLFTEFTKSFDLADITILSEVYQVSGRENIEDKISSLDIVNEIKKHSKKNIFFAKNIEETFSALITYLQENDIVLIMGAGDIYTIVERLAKYNDIQRSTKTAKRK